MTITINFPYIILGTMSFFISRMRSRLRAVVLLILLQLKIPDYKIRWQMPVSQLWKIQVLYYQAVHHLNIL